MDNLTQENQASTRKRIEANLRDAQMCAIELADEPLNYFLSMSILHLKETSKTDISIVPQLDLTDPRDDDGKKCKD